MAQNDITLSTNNNQKNVHLPVKTEGRGVLINGGELLFLALATCFCNDIYREAAKRNLNIISVNVTVNGEFGNEGDPASHITYQVSIDAPSHTAEEISSLVLATDRVAEIHNTLRQGVAVTLVS